MYSESSVVVQVLTDKFGMQSYLINGVKKPKAKNTDECAAIAFHLLDMVVYHKTNTQYSTCIGGAANTSF
jgi:DNA repair protein RecO (recombination protein O)